MFPVKHTVIYTFFAITSVQNTCFCSVFNALASKNLAKSCYVQCFFHFWPFFHCRKATKADIATAILTNVIEHLVLLLPPNKHAFTAKAVWADLYRAIDQKCIATDLMLSHGKDIQTPMLKPEISTQYYHKMRKSHDSLLLDHLVNSNYSFYMQMDA